MNNNIIEHNISQVFQEYNSVHKLGEDDGILIEETKIIND